MRFNCGKIFGVWLLLLFLGAFQSGSAHASAPTCNAAREGVIVYDGDRKVVVFCDGVKWMMMGGTFGSADTLAQLSCANGEIAKFDGTTWACAADSTGGAPSWGSITGVPAGFADGTDDGITSESDPQVGTLTASKWCAANAGGTAIDCTQNAPSTGLPALTSASIWVGNGTNVATAVAMSGDATLSNAGVLTIANNAVGAAEITDASIGLTDLSATGTKSATTYLRGDNTWATVSTGLPALTSANIWVGNGTNVATAVVPTGDVTITNAGVTAIGTGRVINTMLAGSVTLSKLSITGTGSTANFLRGDGSWSSTIVGNVTATAYLHSSDERLKKDIETISNPFALLNGLRGVSYVWKDSGEPAYGFIAQEVEKVAPRAVSTDEKGMKSVEYDQIIAPLVEAVKAQQVEIDSLKQQIRELRDNGAE